jgi:hypothetical protein
MEVSGQLEQLYLRRKNFHYPLVRRLGGPQGMYELGGYEKSVLLLPEMKFRLLSRPARNVIAKQTHLYFIHIVQCWGYLISSDPPIVRVLPLKTPFRLLIGFITISHNHHIAFTQL